MNVQYCVCGKDFSISDETSTVTDNIIVQYLRVYYLKSLNPSDHTIRLKPDIRSTRKKPFSPRTKDRG